jgi:argininosuccinate synthase
LSIALTRPYAQGSYLLSAACAQGNVMVVGRKSPYSLYDEKIASFEDDGGLYDQKDAAGFIKLQALRLRTLGVNRGL